MDTIALRAFTRIVEEGSFSAAARGLGISKSMCSKHVSDLEQRLGARLLTRTTRSVKPTTIGLDYYARVREVLQLMEEADESVKAETGASSGRLKIAAPVTYTTKVMQPHILRFMRAYPSIELEMVLEDTLTDLIGQGFDAAIRVGELADTAMHARRVHSASTHVVASPAYLDEYGRPERPADLSSHRALHYANMRGAGTWPFRLGREVQHQKIHPFFTANNGELIHSAALDGLGVAYMPDFMIREDIESGRLEALLPEYQMPEMPISIVYPDKRFASGALRAFLDFSAQKI